MPVDTAFALFLLEWVFPIVRTAVVCVGIMTSKSPWTVLDGTEAFFTINAA